MDLTQATHDATLFTTLMWDTAIELIPRLVAAALILLVGYLVARLIADRVRAFVVATRHVDSTLAPVLSTAIRYGILIIVAVATLGQLGVQTTSVLAILGAAGLAIGLALQGTLSNIAAGIMLLWLRPFKEGDYIEADSTAGTVREVGLFATQVDTFDGIYRFVPNSAIWNAPLSNYSRNPARMTDLAIGIGYSSNIRRAREIMLELAAADERVLPHPAPEAFVDDLGDNAVVLRYRVWIRNADFWACQRALLEGVKQRFDAEGIDIPFPQRVIHMAQADSKAA
jgi:small conductance mechanosensitive channel